MRARPNAAPTSGRRLTLVLLVMTAAFAVAGVFIPVLNARIDETVARAARFELAFNAVQGKLLLARFSTALAQYDLKRDQQRHDALMTALDVLKARVDDFGRGDFGAFVRSDEQLRAILKEMEQADGRLTDIVDGTETDVRLQEAEDIAVTLSSPFLSMASLAFSHSVKQSTDDLEAIRRHQFRALALTIGLLVSSCALVAMLWWQKRLLEKVHRQQADTSKRYEYLASHDPLTGMANRAYFSTALQRAFKSLQTHGHEVGLLTLDLDQFKIVNDTLGHGAGDALLISVARRLERIVEREPGATAIRLGGDEFSILVEGERVAERAKRIGEAALAALRLPHRFGNLSVDSNASIGVAIAPYNADDEHQLIRSSDIALSRAKSGGRGVIRAFDETMRQQAFGWRALEADLAAAIERNEFVPYYQPQVDLATGKVVGVEALIRWRRNNSAIIAPNQFIPLAEETGLIVLIDRAMLGLVCRDAHSFPPDISVAVNLSTAHFLCNDVVDTIESTVIASGLPPERLELEITESMMLRNEARTQEILTAFRKLGMRIALDDFGIGFSSLAYLRRFQFDKLKIDKAFIDE